MLPNSLEKEIINLRVQNRYAALQLQNIQDEIEHFSAEYYSAIEDICIKLAEIENKINRYHKKIEVSEQGITAVDIGYNYIQPRQTEPAQAAQAQTVADKISFEREVKDLYRSLIKLVHPDVSEEKLKAAEYTMMVNKAYNERNYMQLVELDQLIRSGKATEHELRQQRNKLIDSTFELKMQREELLDNPIYQLSKKFAEVEDGGIAMITDVREKLQIRIADKKRELMDIKLQYLELVGEMITASA
jgi:hypothetical protein